MDIQVLIWALFNFAEANCYVRIFYFQDWCLNRGKKLESYDNTVFKTTMWTLSKKNERLQKH